MNPDLMDPKLCICGEVIDDEEMFCTSECENDFYEVQALAHYEQLQYSLFTGEKV
jgi:predicted nucleic acid-binding Zn ribbon protein